MKNLMKISIVITAIGVAVKVVKNKKSFKRDLLNVARNEIIKGISINRKGLFF